VFCNQCGTEVQTDYNVCPRCGRPVQATLLVPSRLEGHLRILGILWMVVGGLTLIPALILVFLSSVVHVVIPFEDSLARDLGPLLMIVAGASLFIVGAGGLMVGWGLMHHESWARIAAIVVGALALFHPPLGTGLGIYTLWVLLSQNAGFEYDRLARVA
jgi:hypothetical protein